MKFRRHDLLDVDPDVWGATISHLDLPAGAVDAVASWTQRGRPVIVRRRFDTEDDTNVPAALQLPNAYGRHRLAISLPSRSVTRRPPVVLADAAAAAPAPWRPTIAALLAVGERFEPPIVYGGLLWQHVTGEPVLRATSDLDLLWRPRPDRVLALIEALSQIDDRHVRVDGEIELANGGAVAWRELRQALDSVSRDIVVKSIDGIVLRKASDILRIEVASC